MKINYDAVESISNIIIYIVIIFVIKIRPIVSFCQWEDIGTIYNW